MTEKGWNAPHPGEVETMRQFWDAALDRFGAFVQAKHHLDQRIVEQSRPPKPIQNNEEQRGGVTMPKTDLEVFWVSGSPYAWRVLLTLEVKHLKYASQLLEASKGQLRTPDYLQLNSRGTVPTLKDGDVIVRESLAIMAYLDNRYPEPSLFGANARQIANVWRLISEYLSYLHGPATRIIRPLYFGKTAEKGDDILAAVREVHAELARFEGELARSTWFGGEAICAADIAVYPFMKSLVRAAAKEPGPSLSLGLLPLPERYPRLAAWMQAVEQIPGYHNTYPPHWRR